MDSESTATVFTTIIQGLGPDAQSIDLSIIIAAAALIISIIGWIVAYFLNINATRLDRKNNFQLHIYQDILGRSNGLIKLISSYTTSAISHTRAMALVLNEYHSYGDTTDLKSEIDAKNKLRTTWLERAYELTNQSFDMQKSIEDYMRYLDMNGTDYTKGTVVYDALNEIKGEAYKATERNRERWSDYKKMDDLTPKSYMKLSRDTKFDADIIFEFGMCIDDALALLYNRAIASILDKPPKHIDQSYPRRYITANGIVDKRKLKPSKKR